MPLPNSRVIPDGWSEHHRPVAEQTMTATAEVHRPGHQAGFNETIGRSEYPDPAALYAGPCRVQAAPRKPTGTEVGDRQVMVRLYQVSLPASSPEARVNDQVKVTACADDPKLVGRVLRVVDVIGGSLIWQRDLTCEDITPTTR